MPDIMVSAIPDTAAVYAPSPGNWDGSKVNRFIWAKGSGGEVPPGGYVGGYDITGEPLYVARARLDNANLPGKLVPSHGCAYVSWGHNEYRKTEYEVLVGGPHKWVAISGGNIPNNAIPGGQNKDGEQLFVGRVQHEGSVTPGRVQRTFGGCFIPFGGKEIGYTDYEILMP